MPDRREAVLLCSSYRLWALARLKSSCHVTLYSGSRNSRSALCLWGLAATSETSDVPRDTFYVIAALKSHHSPAGVYNAQKRRRKGNGLLATIKANFL